MRLAGARCHAKDPISRVLCSGFTGKALGLQPLVIYPESLVSFLTLDKSYFGVLATLFRQCSTLFCCADTRVLFFVCHA